MSDLPKMTNLPNVKANRLTVYVHLKVNDWDAQDRLLEYYNAYLRVCNIASKVSFQLNTVSAKKIMTRIKGDTAKLESIYPGIRDRAIYTVIQDYKADHAQSKSIKKPRTYNLDRIPVRYRSDYDFYRLGNGAYKIRLYRSDLADGTHDTEQFLAEWLNLPAGYPYTKNMNQATLSYDKAVGWLLKYDIATVTNKVVGIDLGTRFLAVSYDGKESKFYRAWDTPLQTYMEQYSARRERLKAKDSRSARKRLKALSDEMQAYLQEGIDKTVKAILDGAEPHTVFALEDIQASVHLRERFSRDDMGKLPTVVFDKFSRALREESQKRGHIFVHVSTVSTSTTCPKCGMIEKRNRNHHLHLYSCACGFRSNDDRTAAMNIRKRGIARLTSRMNWR